ncbi:uncharacterized protein [Macaca nemestrina]|uniref:uncharacterized protein n=1 Tax=Macaca nemestrina TaxID=9545 RepID=UPI0039B96650
MDTTSPRELSPKVNKKDQSGKLTAYRFPYAHTRNPRGGHQRRALCAQEIYPVKCRKAPTPPDRRGEAALGSPRPASLLALGARSSPLCRRRQASSFPVPAGCPQPPLLPGGGRTGGAVSGAGASRPHLEAGSAESAGRGPALSSGNAEPGARALLRCSRASPRQSLPLGPRGRGAGDPRGGSRSSTAGAAQPAALVPQHSWATDSDRRDLAAPGTLATWRTLARRRQTQAAGARPGAQSDKGITHLPGTEMPRTLRWLLLGLTLSPRLECSGAISAHWISSSASKLSSQISLPSSWDYRRAPSTKYHSQLSRFPAGCCIWPLKRQVKGKRRLRGRAVCELVIALEHEADRLQMWVCSITRAS